MPLFARIDKKVADQVIETWPAHRWHKRSIHFLLNQKANKKNIPNLPVNPGLVKSIKEHGVVSPMLCIDSWYPICGGQRLRACSKMPLQWQKDTVIWVCRFEKPVWTQLYHWHDADEGAKAVQMWFQMCEVIFKTLYMGDKDPSGKPLLDFEEEGNQLQWPHRDSAKGQKIQQAFKKGNQMTPPPQQQIIQPPPSGGAAPPFAKKPMVLPIVSPK